MCINIYVYTWNTFERLAFPSNGSVSAVELLSQGEFYFLPVTVEQSDQWEKNFLHWRYFCSCFTLNSSFLQRWLMHDYFHFFTKENLLFAVSFRMHSHSLHLFRCCQQHDSTTTNSVQCLNVYCITFLLEIKQMSVHMLNVWMSHLNSDIFKVWNHKGYFKNKFHSRNGKQTKELHVIWMLCLHTGQAWGKSIFIQDQTTWQTLKKNIVDSTRSLNVSKLVQTETHGEKWLNEATIVAPQQHTSEGLCVVLLWFSPSSPTVSNSIYSSATLSASKYPTIEDHFK